MRVRIWKSTATYIEVEPNSEASLRAAIRDVITGKLTSDVVREVEFSAQEMLGAYPSDAGDLFKVVFDAEGLTLEQHDHISSDPANYADGEDVF